MASGIAYLPHFEQDGVGIAINQNFLHFLDVAALFSFAPQFVAAAAEIASTPRSQCFLIGLAVHPCQHKHFAAVGILRNGRHQTAGFIKINHDI